MKQLFIVFISLYSFLLSAQNTQPKKHTVQQGNTYYGISKQYGISIDDIKRWNNITVLKTGQVLIVSDPNKIVAEEKEIPVEQQPIITETETQPEKISEEKENEQAAERPQKQETIEDLGFSISETDTSKKDIVAALLPVKTDTAQNNLIFCGGVEEDKPVGISSVFFNNRGQNYVYVFVSQDSVFGVKNLIAELFLKEEDGSTTKVSVTNYEVKPKWKYTIFKHFIDRAGLYEIVVYDNNRKKLGDGQVRILP